MRIKLPLFVLTVLLPALPAMSQSMGQSPRLIEPPRYGQVHEVLGAARYVAGPKAGCPVAMRTFEGGPCLDTVAARLKATGEKSTRVLGVRHAAAPGEAVRGVYGTDYTLIDVTVAGDALKWRELDLPTSEVRVPRNCFALRGEGVFYTVETRGGQTVAQERQTAICGGGPRQPSGPYMPEGPSIPIDPPAVGASVYTGADAWPRTEILRTEGETRYLTQADAGCAGDYLVRKVYCARTGIDFLRANAAVKELDLIGAKRQVRDGDALADDDIEQLVLKRTSNGFKADKRWFAKTMLSVPSGCSANGEAIYRVRARDEGLFVAEEAQATCGAPPPPVPSAIYEVYGDMRPIAYPRQGCPQDLVLLAGTCFQEVVAYMQRAGHNALDVVVMTRAPRAGDRLSQSYDMAKVKRLENGKYEADRKSGSRGNVMLMNRCQSMPSRPSEGQGYIVQWGPGGLMAQAYEWQACPAY
ncbi:MAG: hypothetical protein QM667_09550 [Asticcacaulis sp.]